MVASDKLFFWLSQHNTQRLQPLVASLQADLEGYTFSAPVIKEREARLDGLFLPPPERLADQPAIQLEAQMAPDPEFLLRLYNQSGLLLLFRANEDGRPAAQAAIGQRLEAADQIRCGGRDRQR